MADNNLLTILKKKIGFEISSQFPSIKDEIAEIKSEMLSKNMLQSGMTFKKVADLCERNISIRAEIISKTICTVVETSGIEYSAQLEDHLKEMASKHLPEKLGDIQGYLRQTGKLVGLSLIDREIDRRLKQFRVIRDLNLRRIYTDIEFLMHKMEADLQRKYMDDRKNVFNINAPVGSIQTGDQSISNVNQSIDQSSRDTLSEALKIIKEAVLKEENISDRLKQDILEIVRDSNSEISKEKPSFTKLKELFSKISISVQTMTSLKPAYDLLKSAFACLGIPFH